MSTGMSKWRQTQPPHLHMRVPSRLDWIGLFRLVTSPLFLASIPAWEHLAWEHFAQHQPKAMSPSGKRMTTPWWCVSRPLAELFLLFRLCFSCIVCLFKSTIFISKTITDNLCALPKSIVCRITRIIVVLEVSCFAPFPTC